MAHGADSWPLQLPLFIMCFACATTNVIRNKTLRQDPKVPHGARSASSSTALSMEGCMRIRHARTHTHTETLATSLLWSWRQPVLTRNNNMTKARRETGCRIQEEPQVEEARSAPQPYERQPRRSHDVPANSFTLPPSQEMKEEACFFLLLGYFSSSKCLCNVQPAQQPCCCKYSGWTFCLFFLIKLHSCHFWGQHIRKRSFISVTQPAVWYKSSLLCK